MLRQVESIVNSMKIDFPEEEKRNKGIMRECIFFSVFVVWNNRRG